VQPGLTTSSTGQGASSPPRDCRAPLRAPLAKRGDDPALLRPRERMYARGADFLSGDEREDLTEPPDDDGERFASEGQAV
jgi:hypothetical protein